MYVGVEYSVDWHKQWTTSRTVKGRVVHDEHTDGGIEMLRTANTDRGPGSRILFYTWPSFIEYSVQVPSFGIEHLLPTETEYRTGTQELRAFGDVSVMIHLCTSK